MPTLTSAATPTAASWEALGTSVSLRLTDGRALALARQAVERELAAIDLACSRFRPDSELSCINARAGRRVPASPLMIEALELALHAARLTDGAVDPTVGRALELAGYDRDWRLLPRPLDVEQAPQPPNVVARVRPSWQAVTVDRASGCVRVPSGVSLDLGATAKAWAADRAAAAASRAAGCGTLVSVGGDIATAGACPPDGWRVHVTDDHRSDVSAPGQTVSIVSGGLATSSTAVRRWRHRGATMHHIIDPATGSPVAATWRTVSVAAASCTDANIAATATLVRRQAASSWLGELRLPARLVARDGRVVCIGDWPSDPAAAQA